MALKSSPGPYWNHLLLLTTLCRRQYAIHFTEPSLLSPRHPVESPLAALPSPGNLHWAPWTVPSDLGRLAKLLRFMLQLPTNGFEVQLSFWRPCGCGCGCGSGSLRLLVFCYPSSLLGLLFFRWWMLTKSHLQLLLLQEQHITKQWILLWPACLQTVHLVTCWDTSVESIVANRC